MSTLSPYESPFETASQSEWEHHGHDHQGQHEWEQHQAWTELFTDHGEHEGPTGGTFLHRCAPGEGPPASVPDPEGIGPHPLVLKGTSPRYSRNPSVGYAQLALNRFLASTVAGFEGCIDRSPQRITYMQQLRTQLRAAGQDPLVVDCRFGPNTERATLIVQACHGLVRDGKIGPVTWTHLRKFEVDSPSGGTNPPDYACTSGLETAETEWEFFEPEWERQVARVRPRARLSLAQGSSAHTNHFLCGAGRQAASMLAIANPVTGPCNQRVGATTYLSGADIVNAISAARSCVGQRVDAVHIFSHSGSHGIFATEGQSIGLYRTTDAAARALGARAVTDIPAADLDENVVFVLHGCNNAESSNSVAQALYDHLRSTLANPRVFGHHNSGCASRDNSWREFSNRVPNGQNLRSIAPHYADRGCCTPPKKTEALETEWLEPVAEAAKPCCSACADR
jgi:hypothetical protein